MKQLAASVAGKWLPTRRIRRVHRKVLVEAEILSQQYWLHRRGVAFFNFWETGVNENRWFARFLQRPALSRLTLKRRVAFVSVFGDPRVVDRITADATIFFTGENPATRLAYADQMIGAVDLSLGFDRQQQPGYLRFPLWLLMCFEAEFTLPEVERRLLSWTEQRSTVGSRPKMEASMVARYDPDGSRARTADVFGRYGRVHYGGAFRATGPTIPPGGQHKEAFLRRFPFNICPENSARSGYVTEKVFDAVAAGCIPIYAGPPDAIEPGILNEDAVLRYPLNQPEALSRELAELRDRPGYLRDWSERPPFCPGAAERIYAYYLELEKRLVDLLQ